MEDLPSIFLSLAFFSRRIPDQEFSSDLFKACGVDGIGASRSVSGSFSLFFRYRLKADIMSPIGEA